MKKVQVKASKDYEVWIGSGLLSDIGHQVKPGQQVAVITDQTVASLYLDQLQESLRQQGHEAEVFTFPPGEAAKSMEMLSDILEWLAGIGMTRTDLIIAFGGGVTGDLAGFAASVYLRGISFIQVPTTFLAAIDSSVGGKTAIDLKAGKNLAGSFYQPQQVICDISLLATLNDETFAEGTAEAIKYGILGDRELFEKLKCKNFRTDLEDIIYRCVSMKRDLVETDEFDTGQRQLLNLGHTFGHCIEKLSGYRQSHGNAVAVGLALIARTAESFGHLSGGDREEIIQALKNNGLPTECSYEWEAMMEVMMRDKKRRGGTITLIIPSAIGACALHPLALEEAGRYLQAGLKGDTKHD